MINPVVTLRVTPVIVTGFALSSITLMNVFASPGSLTVKTYRLPVDVVEKDNAFVVTASVPGFKKDEITIEEMSDAESDERELQARRIHESRSTLSADSHWTSASNTIFDGTYRNILRAAKAKARDRA